MTDDKMRRLKDLAADWDRLAATYTRLAKELPPGDQEGATMAATADRLTCCAEELRKVLES